MISFSSGPLRKQRKLNLNESNQDQLRETSAQELQTFVSTALDGVAIDHTRNNNSIRRSADECLRGRRLSYLVSGGGEGKGAGEGEGAAGGEETRSIKLKDRRQGWA